MVGQIDLFHELSMRMLDGGIVIVRLKSIFPAECTMLIARAAPPIYDQTVTFHSIAPFTARVKSDYCPLRAFQCFLESIRSRYLDIGLDASGY